MFFTTIEWMPSFEVISVTIKSGRPATRAAGLAATGVAATTVDRGAATTAATAAVDLLRRLRRPASAGRTNVATMMAAKQNMPIVLMRFPLGLRAQFNKPRVCRFPTSSTE
jgi:hypothetical protein